jgi:hypothetical protein
MPVDSSSAFIGLGKHVPGGRDVLSLVVTRSSSRSSLDRHARGLSKALRHRGQRSYDLLLDEVMYAISTIDYHRKG